MTGFWRRHAAHGITCFLLLPAILCFFGLFFYPMLRAVLLSFYGNTVGAGLGKFVGLEQYATVITSAYFPRVTPSSSPGRLATRSSPAAAATSAGRATASPGRLAAAYWPCRQCFNM